MWTDEKGCVHNIPVPGALPCPFCGEKDIRRNQLWFADSTSEGMRHEDGTLKWTYVECSRCSIQTSAYCYEHQALDHWNRRAAMFVRMDTGLKDGNGKNIREGSRVSAVLFENPEDIRYGQVRFGTFRSALNATADNYGFYVEWDNCESLRKELPFWIEHGLAVVGEENEQA